MNSCGIDFGTSNSAVAVAVDGAVKLTRVEGSSQTIPSAIFYQADGSPVYGREAIRSRFLNDEGRFMRSFKRTLGSDLIEFGAIINGRIKRFDHIIAGFIRQLKTRSEADIGREIDSVVMGRPVHFVDGNAAADDLAQRQLESMARLVGFKNIEFQFEPIAAAFAHERNLTGERLTMVADIGGGTSDFTVIRLSDKARDKIDRKGDILSSAGVRVAGNDFDKAFSLASFMPAFGYQSLYGEKQLRVPLSPFHDMSEWSKINTLYVPKMVKHLREMLIESYQPVLLSRFVKVVEREIGYKILSAVEESKIELSQQMSFSAAMEFVEAGFTIPTTRAEFDEAVIPHIDSIAAEMTECLKSAGVTENEIEMILLTGGTTEVLSLQDMIKKRFPRAEISEENKLSSVAYGLGYDSIRRFGRN